MNQDQLQTAVNVYQSSLDTLIFELEQKPESTPLDTKKVVQVLLARDALKAQLQQKPVLEPALFERIVQLDQRLKANAVTIDAQAGSTVLSKWRETYNPPEKAWWWFLDQRADEAQPRSSALWNILAGFFFAVSLTLIGDILHRFLQAGSANTIHILQTSLQAFLALLAGGAFTKLGREWLQDFSNKLGIQRKLQHRLNVGLALVLFLLVSSFWLTSGWVASFYHQLALYDHERGYITAAISRYEHAIAIDPTQVTIHYNLGTAYEDALRYEDAARKYREALAIDANLYPAYNNLARFYLLHDGKPAEAQALDLLNRAHELVFRRQAADQEAGLAETKVTILKNRAWAYYALGSFSQAERDLKQVLALRERAAAPHCLLAMVYEALDKPKAEIIREWRNCVRFDVEGEVVETEWRRLAQDRLGSFSQKASPGIREETEESR